MCELGFEPKSDQEHFYFILPFYSGFLLSFLTFSLFPFFSDPQYWLCEFFDVWSKFKTEKRSKNGLNTCNKGILMCELGLEPKSDQDLQLNIHDEIWYEIRINTENC